MNKLIRFGLFSSMILFGVDSYAQPAMSVPTVTTITNNSAILGGTIAGSGITARGTAWKISSPVIATDNQLAEGGTAAGAYSHPRASLPPGTQIFFVAYGTDGVGTAISSELSFYTLSNPPIGQPVTFSASAVSSSQIDLIFTRPNNLGVAASGYAIYRKPGATIAGLTLTNGIAPPASIGAAVLVGTTAAPSNLSFSDNTALAGTQYSYALIPFGYNGTNAATYNFLTASYVTTTAFSLAAPPLAQPASFTASTVGETQIDLSFTPPSNGSVAAAGYAIYRRTGNTISGLTLANGAAPPANIGPAVLVGTTPLASDVAFSDNSASAGIQYTYALIPYGYDGVNAATYNYLVTSYATAIGYTFSTVPDNQPASVTATAVSSTQINLSFTALPSPPPGAGNVRGYVILRRTGTDPATSSVQDGVAPGSLSLGASTLVSVITVAGTSTFNDNNGGTGLTTGTQYNYAVVPFNWDNVNTPTYNYKVGVGFTYANATTLNATSTITLNGGTTANIDYINFLTFGGTLINNGGSLNSESLGKFRITDVGGDGAPTTLTDITISIANNSNISEIAIFDSGNTNRGQVTNPGASVSFTGLTGISAANNNNVDFEIYATFKNSVVDQQVITLTITGATTLGTGLSSFAATTGGTANKIRVSSNQFSFVPALLPNTAPNANFAPLTVTAVDAIGNIQLSRSNTVTLSLFSGTGTLNGVPGLVQNLVAGTTTFPNLSITAAGAKTIRATYGVGGVSAGNINITISTPGVLVTAGTLSNSPLCYSGLAQIISPITIAERDPSDFFSGGSFSLTLPPNFVFDTSVTTAPSVTGNEIGGITALSYPASNSVSFSYTVSGTSNSTLDVIVINGLKVRYTGTTNVSGVTLVRSGGTAVQAGNASSDNRIYCTLAAQNSSTVVDFSVSTAPGEPSVNSSDLAFSVGINSVLLVGNPTGGIFSGSGVSFNAGLNSYIFSPASVGVSTANQVVYTYTEPATIQQCQVTKTKSFDVYASVVQGLQSQYCKNGSSTPLSVLPANIPLGYQFYDFVYLASVKNQTSVTTFDIVKTYFYLGTATPAIQIIESYTTFTSGPPFNFSFDFLTGVLQTINNPSQGLVTSFNPQLILPYSNLNSIQVYFRIQEIVTPANISLSNFGITKIVNPPSVTFSLPKYTFCANEVPQSLTGIPTPSSIITDQFTTIPPSAGGISNIGNVWTFSPSSVTPGQLNVPFQIRYDYTSPTTTCSDFKILNVAVYGIPTAPVLASTNSPVIVCQGSTPTALTATPAANTVYSWYSQAALGAGNLLAQANSFTPTNSALNGNTFNNNVLFDFPFFLTQTVNGCEGPSVTVNANVKPVPTLSINAGVSICAGGVVDISQSAVNATIGGGATQATWSSLTGGTFTGGNTNINPPNVATTYQPNAAEVSAGSVILTLTTNQPNLACPAAAKQYQVSIKKIPAPPSFLKTGNALPDGTTLEYCDNSIDPKIVAAGAGTGSISFYKNSLLTILSLDVADNPSNQAFVNYNFNPSSERTVSFLITQTTDKALPLFAGCTSQARTLNVLLHPLPAAAFTASQFCEGTATQFTGPTALPSGPAGITYAVKSYAWKFGDGNSTTTNPDISSFQNPAKTYSQRGSYSPSLTFTTATTNTNFECSNTYTQTPPIEIGPVPQTDFTFSNQCFGDNTSFVSSSGSLFDNTSPGKTIQTWQWVFDTANAGTSSLTQTALPNPAPPPPPPNFNYARPGSYTASLRLTSELNCFATKTIPVYILPKIAVSDANIYGESFENNSNVPNNNIPTNFGAWASEQFKNSNSWNLVQPAPGPNITITTGSNSPTAWVAGLNGVNKTYSQNEISVLNSPCFDITGLSKPIIAFDYIADTRVGNDGAYLQVSTDNGLTWSTFGKKDQGILWYSNSFIIGLSGSGNLGQSTGQEGWDGTKSDQTQAPAWATARYTLSKNLPPPNMPLRFRFYFGTQAIVNPANSKHSGFGIDNVFIQSSNRTVLAESFSNSSASGAGTFNTNFKNFQASTSVFSLVKIQYRTSFGGDDVDNKLNPADPMARAAFYGLSSAQSGLRGFIDGSDGPSNSSSNSYFNGNIFSVQPPAAPSNADNYYDTRILVPSPVSIKQTSFITKDTNTDDVVNVRATVDVYNSPLPAGKDYFIHMAIVENVNGQFILRKMLPDASGTRLTSLAALSTQIVNYTWKVSSPYDPNKLSAICFIQELGSKDILQANQIPLAVSALVTGVEPGNMSPMSFYPIPADKELLISLGEAALTNTPVLMYDAVGKAVHQTTIDKGQQSKTVNTQDFAPGVYIIQLETDKGTVRKKVMVAH